MVKIYRRLGNHEWSERVNNESHTNCDFCGEKLWINPGGDLYCEGFGIACVPKGSKVPKVFPYAERIAASTDIWARKIETLSPSVLAKTIAKSVVERDQTIHELFQERSRLHQELENMDKYLKGVGPR